MNGRVCKVLRQFCKTNDLDYEKSKVEYKKMSHQARGDFNKKIRVLSKYGNTFRAQ